MNSRRLTDAQISTALRAHLPAAAAPGLRERVFEGAESTSQLRALPSFLGTLSDADPVTRRRSLLIAAALLVALAVASAAAVGALRLLERDPVDELSLEPPDDVPAFVLSSYERLLQLPPVALTWHDSDSDKGRIYVDASGAVRFDEFASPDATDPSGYRILSRNRISGMATVESEAVWVEPGHEAIDDNAREYIRTVLSGGYPGPGCEMERDPSEVDNGSVATGWRYVGLEYVAGRPTHRVACTGELGLDTEVWIDIETRLILRTQGPAVDDAGQPIPVAFTEVTEIAFGEQPAALFEPPDGLARISADEYGAYICARDLPNELAPGISDCPAPEEAEGTPPEATSPLEPSPTSMATEPPATNECPIPPGASSEPVGPLAWTQESLNEDWPAPVRPEPAGGGRVQPMPPTYRDPTSDIGSDAYPCVDIRWLMADTSEVHLKLVAKPPPVVDPAEQWIAYGVVTDEDGDGVPDWRYGIDKMTSDTAEAGRTTRGWRTNLHTGETQAGPYQGDPPWGRLGGDFQGGLSTESADWEPDAGFGFNGSIDTTQGVQHWGFELDMPFYTWASVIVNGRVVATDYAPDSGWLRATPGVAITPNKFPGGAHLLELEHASLGTEPGTGSVLEEELHPPLRVLMTVPHGWTVGGPWGESPTGSTGIEFDVVGDPWDACPDTTEPKLGPSFDDLVGYLQVLPRIVVSEVRNETLDGHRTAHLEYRPADGWFDCMSGSPIRLEPGNNEAWIVDVDGVRLVIAVWWEEPPSEKVRSEIRQIVESIQFER